MLTPAAAGGAFAEAIMDVPEPPTSLCTIVCRALCCGGKNRAHDDAARSFPRTPIEFGRDGAAWATSVLRAGGKMAQSNSVSSVAVSALGAQGLLSELCLATLEYSEPDAELPTEVVVKFSPAELKTRITMNIFGLSKAEYLMYRHFLPTLPKSITTPTLWGGDFNYANSDTFSICVLSVSLTPKVSLFQTSNKVCMMLEKVDATFLDQTDAEKMPTVAHFEKIFECLAELHAHCWGQLEQPGLSWVEQVDGPVFALFPPEVKKAWSTWVTKVADPGFECASAAPPCFSAQVRLTTPGAGATTSCTRSRRCRTRSMRSASRSPAMVSSSAS